jgi:hypothetical protein
MAFFGQMLASDSVYPPALQMRLERAASEVDPIGRTTGSGLLVGFSAVPIS